jgi:hypothetical protein
MREVARYTAQFSPTHFFYASRAVAGCVAICELLFNLGFPNAGAIFWVPILWASRRCGLIVGQLTAVLACAAFYFSQMPPRYEIGTDFVGYATLQMVMLAVSAFIALPPARFYAPVVIPANDYLGDCNRGTAKAREFMAVLMFGRECFRLGWMVRDLVNKRKWTGEEVGFFHTLSQALVGDLSARRYDPPDNLNGEHVVLEVDRDVVPAPVRHQ